MLNLVFIHLPKTGGSSILESLKQAYGENHVRHFERDECIALNRAGQRISDVLEEEIKVIHGHFLYSEVQDLIERDQPKVVTFMRNPNERLVSNYHWWRRTLKAVPNHPEKHRLKESLLTYASRPEVHNKMSQFLEGIELEQLFFVGFLEQFNEDIEELSKLLDWPKISVFHEKKSLSKPWWSRKGPSGRTLRKIQEYNLGDWELYKTAKNLRASKSLMDSES